MKILYLHQYFNTPAMSGGTRSYEMARRLVSQGHEVHLITSRRDGGAKGRNWEVTEEEGIVVHWLPVPYSNAMSYGKRILAFFRFAIGVALRAASLGGNVVFATSTPLTIALPGAYVAWRRKIPMVFEVRDLWPEIPIAVGVLKNPFLKICARWLERFAYKNAEQVVALSPGMKKRIVKSGYPSEKIHIIPNGCDTDLFQVPESEEKKFLNAHPELQDGPLILYAGTLGLINGVGYLVDIASAMLGIDPAVRFLIVGEGREQNQIREKAANAGVLKKNLWIMSPVPKSEMSRLLSAATISTSLVIDLPELWNNSANKFFDALAAGRPIMINHEGWQADLIRETGAGLVVPPTDAVQSARMLHDFLSNTDRIEKAGRAAFHLGKTQFDRDDLARNLLDVLQMACDPQITPVK